MTAPVANISKKEAEPTRSGRSNPGSPAAFAASLDTEQADLLLRQTDQYAQWQRLRQKSDAEAQKLVPILLARNALLQESAQGKPINWQEFDRLTAQLGQSGIKLPSSRELQAETQAPPAPSSPPPAPPPSDVETTSPAAPADTLIKDENLLVLSVVCRSVGLKQEITGYGDGQTTLLPLGEVAQALGFSVTVDTNNKTATGWFISEDRTFKLDADSQTIRIDGNTYSWDDNAIAIGDGEIYVESNMLAKWLPVDFSVSTGEMTVTATPREKLPLQLQFEREKKRQGLGKEENTSLKYPPVTSPYELYSFPSMDFSLTSGIETTDKGSKTELRQNHSVVAEGDLAHMNAHLFLSGNEESPLDNGRITLEKLDPEAKLLGSMHASQVKLGDIAPVELPILGSSGTARGVSVSNADIQRSRDFDTTRFEGNMQPGWDVELYQNGSLINSVRVASDGRYLFEDIPVYFGNNAFQVVAHGPQGQRRIIEAKDINVGSGMLQAGKVEYNLSATQQKKTLPGIDPNITATDEGGRLTGSVAYGLTDQLSVNAGLSSVEFENTWHNYLQSGLSGTFASVYGEVDALQDVDGGNALSLQGQTALGPFNLRGKHEIFSDFIEPNNPNRILQSRSSAGINGQIPQLFLSPPFSYTLSRTKTTYDDSENGSTDLRLASQINRVHMSNVIRWNDNAETAASGAKIDGEFRATGAIGPGRLTAGLEYDLGDKNEISQYNLTGTWPITDRITAGTSLIREEGDIQGTSAELNLAFDTGKVILTPKVFYQDDGDYGAFLTVSFSLSQDPVSKDMLVQSEKKTGKGSATAFVYHDSNNNKVFDQDDTPLPDVKVVAQQVRKNGKTNDQGVAQLTNLAAFVPTDVEIDTKTLEDPFMQPAVPGIAVMPRSGSVNTLEFPVVMTGEIDGTLSYENGSGKKEALARVQLELRDDKGNTVQTTTTEYDGFYLFEKVFPGTYTLHVDSEDPHLKESAAGLQKEIVIGNDGTISRGNNILLQAPDAKNRSKENNFPQRSLSGSSEKINAPSGATSSSVSKAPLPTSSSTVKQLKDNNKSEQKESVALSATAPKTTSAPVPATSDQGDLPGASKTATSISIAPLIKEETLDHPLAKPEKNDFSDAGSKTTGSTPPTQPVMPSFVPAPVNAALDVPVASIPASSITIAPLTLAQRSDLPSADPRRNSGGGNEATDATLATQPPVSRPVKMAKKSPPLTTQTDSSTPTSPVAAKPMAPVPDPSMRNGNPSSETKAGSPVPLSQERLFGVHLASYKSKKSAQTGVQILAKRLSGLATADDLTIVEVDLGKEKGTYYRVVCGQFGHKEEADRLAERLMPRTEYARSIMLKNTNAANDPIAPQPIRRHMQTNLGPAAIAAKYAAMQLRR